jgi:hypothetical protein
VTERLEDEPKKSRRQTKEEQLQTPCSSVAVALLWFVFGFSWVRLPAALLQLPCALCDVQRGASAASPVV